MEGEQKKPLDITNEISNKYHIEYGKPKSNSLQIRTGKNKIKTIQLWRNGIRMK